MQLNCFKSTIGKKYTLFPAAQSGTISAHASAAASFSRSILNKYTSPEDYGMPLASFVHPAFDQQEQEEDALALSVKILLTLNHFQNISISSAYEKRYYNLLCRQCIQLLSNLGNSQGMAGTDSRKRLSEPDSRKELSGLDSRKELSGTDSRKELSGLDSRKKLSGFNSWKEFDVLHGSKESVGLENQKRLENLENQQYQRTAIKKELEKYLQEIRREVEGTKVANSRENPGEVERTGSADSRENPGEVGRTGSADSRENPEEVGRTGSADNRETSKRQAVYFTEIMVNDTKKSVGNIEISVNDAKKSAGNIEISVNDAKKSAENIEISMESVQRSERSAEDIEASMEISQRSAEDTEKLVEERRRERQQRLTQILAGMENHRKKHPFAQNPRTNGQAAYLMGGSKGNPSFLSWKSEQAKQFFWRVQRAPQMEQRLLLAASNTKTIVGLMNKLKMVGQHQWAVYAAALQERVKSIIEDRAFLLSVSRESRHFGTENPSKAAETKKDTDTKSAADKERTAAGEEFLSSEKTWFSHLRHWLLNEYQEADTQEELLAQKEEMILRMHEEWTEIEKFCRRIWENDENAGKRKQEEYQRSRNILTNSKVLSAYGLSTLDEALLERESNNFEKYILPEFVQIRTTFAEYIRQMEAGKWKDRVSALQSVLKEERSVLSLESIQKLLFAEKVNEESIIENLVQESLDRLHRQLQEDAENEKEKIQSLKSEEIREWYQTAMEAISYLGDTEWSTLKEELSFAFHESLWPVPVFQWLLEEKTDAKEEKRNFIAALGQQMTEEIEFVRQMTEDRIKVIYQMTENRRKIFRHMTQNRNEMVYQIAENQGEMIHQMAEKPGKMVYQMVENQGEMIHRVEENQTEMIRRMTENQMEVPRRMEENQREEVHQVEENQSDMIYRMGEVQTGDADARQTTADKIVDKSGNIYQIKDEPEFYQPLTYLQQHVTESDKEIKREEKERGEIDRTQTINSGTGNSQFTKQGIDGEQDAKRKNGSFQKINADIFEPQIKSQHTNSLQANRHERYEAFDQNAVRETSDIQEELIQGEAAQSFVYLRRWLNEKNQENHEINQENHAKNRESDAKNQAAYAKSWEDHVNQTEEIGLQKEDFLALLEREIRDNRQVWDKIRKNPQEFEHMLESNKSEEGQKLDEINHFSLEQIHKFEAWERVRKLFENSKILSAYIYPENSAVTSSQVSSNFQTLQNFQAAPNLQNPQDFQASSNFQIPQNFQAAPNLQNPQDFQTAPNLKHSPTLLPASFVYFIRQMHTGEWKEWKQGVQAILEKKEPFVETIRNIFSLMDPGRWYQNVMEAISYLDEGEWKALKQEISASSSSLFSEEEPFLQAVPLLLRHSEKKADMGEEKRRLIHVLVRQMNEEKEVMERLRQHNVQDFTLFRERRNIDERLHGIRENFLEMLRTYEDQTKKEAHKIFFSLDGSRPGMEVFSSIRWLKQEDSYGMEYSGIKMREAAIALVERIRENRIRILSPTAEERNQEERNQEERNQEERIQEKRNELHHPEIMQDESSLSYHSAAMVVAEHAGGRTNQQEELIRQKPSVELSADIVQQVREETDIQFKTREQRTAESGQENIRAEMEEALKKLEQQQIDLEAKFSGSQEKLSKAVLKKLQSQLRIDRMRHGM